MKVFSLFIFLSIWAEASASKNLFNKDELKRLEQLKNSKELLYKNNQAVELAHISDLYRSDMLIMSNVEVERRKNFSAYKELDRFDQHYFFNKILDRKLRQKWIYPKPKKPNNK